MTETDSNRSLGSRLIRFVVGATALTTIIALLASGYSPPGVCGEVLRHNQVRNIDASPLFYTEVENMAEIERGLADLRRHRRRQEDSAKTDAAKPRWTPAEIH